MTNALEIIWCSTGSPIAQLYTQSVLRESQRNSVYDQQRLQRAANHHHRRTDDTFEQYHERASTLRHFHARTHWHQSRGRCLGRNEHALSEETNVHSEYYLQVSIVSI